MAQATFRVNLSSPQHLFADELKRELVGSGWRLEKGARKFIERHYSPFRNGGDKVPVIVECDVRTPRELGCTEHPLTRELLNRDRLYAASQKYLGGKDVYEFCPHQSLLPLCVLNDEKKLGDTLTVAMWPLDGYVLQAVRLPATEKREKWIYAVPASDEKRWSLDQPFLFWVRKASPRDIEFMKKAEFPLQQKVTERVVCPRKPEIFDDLYPGQYCGQMAMKSILGAFGKSAEVKELRLRGFLSLYGWLYNILLARTTPQDIAAMLREHGLEARWHFWNAGMFQKWLEFMMEDNHLINVIAYAQRRFHGQHSQLVSGFEVYGGKTYFYVTDAQFGKKEYDLPSGNVLLSPEDFIRSFPRYGLWLFSFGAFVNEVSLSK